MKIIGVLLSLLFVQDTLERDVMARLMTAMAPVIQQFPQTDDTGTTPTGNNTEALWMVRPLEPGEKSIEILANPLNEQNQRQAARAMALIEKNIEAAQRKAAAQYERAVAEAKRTGKSQEVDGVSLSDEGIEGQKIDAESQVTIDVAFNHPAYRYLIDAPADPVKSTQAGAMTIVSFAPGVYRDADKQDRFFAAETVIFLGQFAEPTVTKRGDNSYELFAAATPTDRNGLNTLVVRYKGNEVLVKELVSKTVWAPLLELMK